MTEPETCKKSTGDTWRRRPCGRPVVDAVGRSLEASEAIHELSVNATSDRSYMTPEGFEAAIRDVRAEAWHQGWVASEAYTGRSAFPVNPYEDQVCGWVPAGPFCDLEPGHDGPHG